MRSVVRYNALGGWLMCSCSACAAYVRLCLRAGRRISFGVMVLRYLATEFSCFCV